MTTGDWQPVYAALIMILLVFFVMLISHARFGDKDMRRLQKTVLGKEEQKEPPVAARRYEPVGSLRNAMARAGLSQDVGIVRAGEGVRLAVKGLVFYAPKEATMLPKAELILREVLRYAEKSGSRIEVNVGADCRSNGDGSMTPDWEMATLRSSVVHRYLAMEKGFPVERLKTAARGLSCPAGAAGQAMTAGAVTILLDR